MSEAWRVKAAPVDALRHRRDVDRLREYFTSTFKHGTLYALITTLGVNLGLRAGDLLALRVGDIRGKTHLEVTERKTSKTRRIFINGRVRAEVDAHLAKYLFVVDESRLFTAQKGYPLTVKSLHRLIKDGCHAIGLEGNYGTHTLRKTFAHHAHEYTQDIRAVRRLLRHTALSVTRVYVTEGNDETRYTRSDDEVYSALNL